MDIDIKAYWLGYFFGVITCAVVSIGIILWIFN